uniref:SPX and EXS domain-containing protein 1 isoform X1 n=1 Tax=Rhizophora mucronata TaxID=61149 RepID=A0A2P2LUR7_RHIMU
MKPQRKNNSTLNLHNKMGDGIMVAVVIGAIALFESFDSIECERPSSTPFPCSPTPRSKTVGRLPDFLKCGLLLGAIP